MTDDEYRDYLVALARRHLRVGALHRMGPGGALEHLHYEIDRLSSVARFVKVVADRSENPLLLKELAQEVRNTYVSNVIDSMDRAGVLDALDEAPDITFENLRRSAIPEEDMQLLRRAGVDDPDAEVTIIIHYSRKHVGGPDSRPSDIARRAQAELKRAADRLDTLAPGPKNVEPSEGKKTKLFNGIGKILAGAVTGAGNMLLATGTVIAPNPATAYGAIGSAALAIGSVCQGIGDLRGE